MFPPNLPEDDLDEGEISLAKIKSDLGFADDEEGTFLGVMKNDGRKRICLIVSHSYYLFAPYDQKSAF